MIGDSNSTLPITSYVPLLSLGLLPTFSLTPLNTGSNLTHQITIYRQGAKATIKGLLGSTYTSTDLALDAASLYSARRELYAATSPTMGDGRKVLGHVHH